MLQSIYDKTNAAYSFFSKLIFMANLTHYTCNMDLYMYIYMYNGFIYIVVNFLGKCIH